MKKRIVVLSILFMCIMASAQTKDVCENEPEKIEEQLNTINDSKCILEKASALNKDKNIIKSRVANRTYISVQSSSKKRSIRYLNKRKRKLSPIVKAEELSRGIRNTESKEILFILVDELPKFINCEENSLACFNSEFKSHFSQYFTYPEQAIKDKLEGRVFVKFTIDKDGNLCNINTYSSGHKTILEDEVKRVLLNFPKFQPGKEQGRNVNVIHSIPVDFKL